MTLYLVQHGAAVPEQEDPERPLSAQGAEDIERLAGLLAHLGVSVARVLHSGKTRAAQTAAKLATAVLNQGEPEVASGLKPKDAPGLLAERLAGVGEDWLLVSHQPLLGRLTSRLVGGDSARPLVALQPGTLVALEPDADSGWQIALLLPPDVLNGRR
jgi:phosphohistidine phosphatase